MKETGLMFKAPLVRAILSGQKTQTRRAVKGVALQWLEAYGFTQEFVASSGNRLSPVGHHGDRIYVRETFVQVPTVCGGHKLIFAADYQDGSDKAAGVKYTPAIHMPKSASRIWLEVTGVRVERLQDISEVDCRAEGAHGGHGSIPGYAYSATPREHFQHIWESTGGDWAANPCVWVVGFKQIPLPREQSS